MLSDILII